MKIKPWVKWGVIGRTSTKSIDGSREWISGEAGKPFLFNTRKEAREFIERNYAYFFERKDLLNIGWKVPVARKLRIDAL